jgi:hypothetical protein
MLIGKLKQNVAMGRDAQRRRLHRRVGLPPHHRFDAGTSWQFHFDDYFYVDGDSSREFGHADRGARMATALTKHRDHEIREAIEHIRLLVKTRRAIYHAEYLHDLADTIKASERVTDGREDTDSDETSGLVSLVERQIRSDLPRDTTPILTRRAMP